MRQYEIIITTAAENGRNVEEQLDSLGTVRCDP